MKFIFGTCALFLVLPWKLMCETSRSLRSPKQHEDTTIRAYNLTTFSPKYSEQHLKPNDETTYSTRNKILHKSTLTAHGNTVGAEELTTSSTKHPGHLLKPNVKTTHNPSSIGLQHETTTFSPKYPEHLETNDKATNNPNSTWMLKGNSKENETNMRTDKHTTKKNGNNLSTETMSQTSGHQGDKSLSTAKYASYAISISTGERRSSLHLSSAPFLTQKQTITPLPQDAAKEVKTTRDDQTSYNFKFTNKGLDRHTQGNRTTRSAEKESFKPQTGISTNFQKTPEVITNQSGIQVRTTETLTTKWSSLSQERESTQPPMLNITYLIGTLNISNEERNDTATNLLSTSTTTAFSTSLGLTVHTDGGTSGTTDTIDIKTTYEITTKLKTSDIKSPNPNSETTPHTKTTATKSPVKDNNKMHPGPVIASLIGSILFLMFAAFVVILVGNRRMRKNKMENSNWAGPSPFIESDIQPNLPTNNDEGPFYRYESKKISLHSFLPQRLSKRLSMLNPMDEEVPFEDIKVTSSFGKENAQALNGKAASDKSQTHKANSSPEVSRDSSVPETLSIPPTPESDRKTQPAPKFDKEIVPSTPEETKSVTPIPFEDVDLNAPLNKNADAIRIPTPPPLPPS